MAKKVSLPLTDETIADLQAGDTVLLTGVMYVARDAAHKRIVEALDRGEKPPFDLKGQTVYYAGPTPARPGQVIGSFGPTTSGRMDAYSPRLLAEGLKGMIGKGQRSAAVKEAIKKHKAVYLAAIGGRRRAHLEVSTQVDRDRLPGAGRRGCLRLEVEDFPATVINDIYGGDFYEIGKARYRKG